MVLLPEALQETSGVAVSRISPGVFWTHTDERAELVAIGAAGEIRAHFALDQQVSDPEDVSVGECPGGEACLYLADTGDNAELRAPGDARILRVREPRSPAGNGALRAEVFPVRLPDGARDTEALFVLPGERVFLITKGRQHAVTVYRYPGVLRPEVVTLEEVQRLTDVPQSLLDQVTGASASPSGEVVAVRTYRALRLYDVREGALAERAGGLVNLRPLEEIQGEGVGLGPDGLVALTSEGGALGGPASLTLLRCRSAP
jgi:hypothetical protein